MLVWEICLRNIKWKKHVAKQCIEQYYLFLNSLPYLYLRVCLSDFLEFGVPIRIWQYEWEEFLLF